VSWSWKSKKKPLAANQPDESDPEYKKAAQNLEIELKARTYRLNDEAIAKAKDGPAPFDTVSAVRQVFFGSETAGQLGCVTRCSLCGAWASPQNAFFHLRAIHELDMTPDMAKVSESMHAMGCTPRDIAAALGARV
jgi:hypothetical protein